MSTVNLQKKDDRVGLFSIAELAGVVGRQWKLMSICTLVALVCGVVLYTVIPAKWKGTVTIQIGKIPQKAANENPLIEPADQLVARVESKDFLNQIMVSAKIPVADIKNPGIKSPEATLLERSLKAISIRNADFVQISFSAYTRDELKTIGSAIAQEILAVHGRISLPIQQRLAADHKSVVGDIAQADVDRARLNAELAALKAPAGDRQYMANVTVLSLLENNSSHVDRLRKIRMDLEKDMAPSNLYASSATEVLMDSTPYFPKLGVFVALAIIFGVVAGLIIALTVSRRQNAQG